MKCPGSRWVHETVAGGRLIPFYAASNDSHVIVAEHLRFQFIRFGAAQVFPAGYVADPDSDTTSPGGGPPAEGQLVTLATPYTLAELPDLKWTSANDIMFLFHPNHPNLELRRYGLFDWALVDPSFGPTIAAPTGLNAVKTEGTTAVYQTDWSYVVTATGADGLESYASAPDNVLVDMEAGRNNYVTLTWVASAGATRYTIYKGVGGIYGFIGYATGLTYKDNNYAPNLSLSAPIQNLPFDSVGNYPRVGEFLQQRMFYASTREDPQTIWASKTASFYDLSYSVPIKSDDGFEFTIVAKLKQTINHLVAFDYLIAFTETAEWAIRPVQGDVIAADTVDPKPSSWYGSDPFLTPIPVGDRILFVKSKGRAVLDLSLTADGERFTAEDRTVMAPHLFRDRSIIRWAWAEVPHAQLFCVLDDGEAVILTYQYDQEVWGWSTRGTDGAYEDVVSVPEIVEDGLYVTAAREVGDVTRYYVERMESAHVGDVADCFYVDSGLSYDEPQEITDAQMVGDNLQVEVVGHELLVGDIVRVDDVQGFESELEPRYDVNSQWTVTGISDDLLTLTSETAAPPDLTLWEPDTGVLRLCLDELFGMGHLAGRECTALADGNVIESVLINEDGSILLPYKAGRVHVGFGYGGRIETLALDTQGAEGTSYKKSTSNVLLYLTDSRGVLAGVPGRPLYEVKPRAFEGYYDPNALMTGTALVNIPPNWKHDAHIVIEAPYPLPCTISRITPELEYGRG